MSLLQDRRALPFLVPPAAPRSVPRPTSVRSEISSATGCRARPRPLQPPDVGTAVSQGAVAALALNAGATRASLVGAPRAASIQSNPEPGPPVQRQACSRPSSAASIMLLRSLPGSSAVVVRMRWTRPVGMEESQGLRDQHPDAQ